MKALLLLACGFAFGIFARPHLLPIAPVAPNTVTEAATPTPGPQISAAPTEEPATRSGRYVVSRSALGTTQVRELPPGVSHSQSLGLGGGGGPIATPKPQGGEAVRDQWGWKAKGALDQKPR